MKVQTRPQKSCFHLWMRVNSKKNLLNSTPAQSTQHSIATLYLWIWNSNKSAVLNEKYYNPREWVWCFWLWLSMTFSQYVYIIKKNWKWFCLVQLMHHRFFWTKTILRNIVEKNKLKKLQKISKNSVQTNLFVSFYNWT